MSIDRLFTTRVTLIEPGSASDGYGGTAPDWDNPSSSTAAMGWLTQLSSTEAIGTRDTTVSGWRLFLPACTYITSKARVYSDGTTYEVDGVPDATQTGRGAHHIEVRLRVASEVVV